ncbi:MAG TPA: LamG-like jellyroll fold domain-containing protein [Verrucomicrobiae bacterium]|nr:LamG-like jellyroll fold domain-containing protein [Verrucomicrobiae bacterium]
MKPKQRINSGRGAGLPALTAALVAAGVLGGAQAQQIQSAGALFVNVDATALPAGPLNSITNNGTLGGFFVATGAAADVPVIGTTGGTKGIQLDGTDFLQHMTAASGGSPLTSPAEITGDNPTASIEVWALNPDLAGEETLVSWGNRGGPDGSNMSFNYGSDFRWGAVGHWGNPDLGWNNQGGGPEAGKWHHLVYTYDGTTTRVYSDGVFQNGEFLGDGRLSTHPDTTILIGSQMEGDGITPTAGLRFTGTIARVRVHDGVLTPEQIASNYNAEKAAFIDPATPPAPGPVTSAPISAPPKHRYNFNETAGDATSLTFKDSAGTADGTVQGSGATFTGSRLVLPGGGSADAPYGDLPNGLLSENAASKGGGGGFTFETWMKISAAQNWSRVFDFGSSGTVDATEEILGPGGSGEGRDYFMYSAMNGTDTSTRRLEVRNEDPAGGGIVTVDNRTTAFNQDVHLVVTWDEATGTITAYENGLQVSSSKTDDKLSDINDVNVWLGRSNYTGDSNLQGEYDEVRLYNYAFTPGQALGSSFSGPDKLSSEPAPVTITSQPQSVTSDETGNATLKVGLRGSSPISIQWYRNDVAIPGAILPSLTINNTSAADSGARFTVRVTNIVNGATTALTSDVATLTVKSPTVSLKHRYSFSETSGTTVKDSVGAADGTVEGGGGEFSGGQLGLDGLGSYVNLPNGLLSGLGADGTVELWITQRESSVWSRVFDFGVSTSGVEDEAANGEDYFFFVARDGDGFPRFVANFPDAGDVTTLDPAPPGWIPGNQEKHIAITWSFSGNTARLYFDGVLVATGLAPRALSDMAGKDINNWLGRSQFIADAGWGGKYNEVRLSSGAMTPSQVQASFAAGPDALPGSGGGSPKLTVKQAANTVVISWPASATGYVLEGATAVTGAWSAVNGASANGDQMQVTVNTDGGQRFFRLKKG